MLRNKEMGTIICVNSISSSYSKLKLAISVIHMLFIGSVILITNYNLMYQALSLFLIFILTFLVSIKQTIGSYSSHQQLRVVHKLFRFIV